MPRWSLSGITKRYRQGNRDVTALDGIDLTLEPGGIAGGFGAGGGGQEHAFAALGGFEIPDAGRLRRDEDDITYWPPDKRDIAMVFQNFAVYPHLTVHDNLAFPLRPGRGILTAGDIENRVQSAAEMLGISALLQRQPGTLSGGELQRVAIGRCLVRRPGLFLFDEPLVNLDAKLREGLRSEMHRIQRETGIPMIYVTHDQAEAMTLADRLAVLVEGRLLQIGDPETIYSQPVDSRVARLLGMPPINLIDAAQAQALGLPAGDGLFAGLRPESLQVQSHPQGIARVIAVERLGHAEIIVVEAAGQLLRSYVQGGAGLLTGDRVQLAVEAKALQWFPN